MPTPANTVNAIWARLKSAVKGEVVGNAYLLADDDGAAGVVQHADVTFTQTSGNGVYTGTVDIPAGGTVHDVIISGVALWDGTSAAMIVGDAADPNGYFDAVDLVATDLLAGEDISFALAGGQAGAYIAASQANKRYSATARTITGEVTQVGTGTLGRTRMTVIYSLPVTSLVTAATKV